MIVDVAISDRFDFSPENLDAGYVFLKYKTFVVGLPHRHTHHTTSICVILCNIGLTIVSFCATPA